MTHAITQKTGFYRGTSGERSRDLRIKRPCTKNSYLRGLLGSFFGKDRADNPRVGQLRNFRGRDHYDPLSPLRGWGCP
jgi:hypothetical protein